MTPRNIFKNIFDYADLLEEARQTYPDWTGASTWRQKINKMGMTATRETARFLHHLLWKAGAVSTRELPHKSPKEIREKLLALFAKLDDEGVFTDEFKQRWADDFDENELLLFYGTETNRRGEKAKDRYISKAAEIKNKDQERFAKGKGLTKDEKDKVARDYLKNLEDWKVELTDHGDDNAADFIQAVQSNMSAYIDEEDTQSLELSPDVRDIRKLSESKFINKFGGLKLKYVGKDNESSSNGGDTIFSRNAGKLEIVARVRVEEDDTQSLMNTRPTVKQLAMISQTNPRYKGKIWFHVYVGNRPIFDWNPGMRISDDDGIITPEEEKKFKAIEKAMAAKEAAKKAETEKMSGYNLDGEVDENAETFNTSKNDEFEGEEKENKERRSREEKHGDLTFKFELEHDKSEFIGHAYRDGKCIGYEHGETEEDIIKKILSHIKEEEKMQKDENMRSGSENAEDTSTSTSRYMSNVTGYDNITATIKAGHLEKPVAHLNSEDESENAEFGVHDQHSSSEFNRRWEDENGRFTAGYGADPLDEPNNMYCDVCGEPMHIDKKNPYNTSCKKCNRTGPDHELYDLSNPENAEDESNNQITAEIGPRRHGLPLNNNNENEEEDIRPGINTCEYSTTTRKRHCGKCSYCHEHREENEEIMNKPTTAQYMGEENNEYTKCSHAKRGCDCDDCSDCKSNQNEENNEERRMSQSEIDRWMKDQMYKRNQHKMAQDERWGGDYRR